MSEAMEWCVRVWVGEDESDDPAYDTALYIACCPTASEAEEAVRKFRSKAGERLEVLKDPAAATGRLQPGEVRRLRYAV